MNDMYEADRIGRYLRDRSKLRQRHPFFNEYPKIGTTNT